MEKGKLYSEPHDDNNGDPACPFDLIDEAKRDIPVMKHIAPYVIEDGMMNEKQAKELSDYLRKDMAWKFRWFGEGKYIE